MIFRFTYNLVIKCKTNSTLYRAVSTLLVTVVQTTVAGSDFGLTLMIQKFQCTMWLGLKTKQGLCVC